MTDNLNLGRPLNDASHTSFGGSALSAAGSAGDYTSTETGFAKDVLNSLDNRSSAGISGGQHTVAGQYATTHPESGFQRTNEHEPHRTSENDARRSTNLTGGQHTVTGQYATTHPESGFQRTNEQEPHRTSENDARRSTGLTGGYTGPSTREFDNELNDPRRGQPDLVGHTAGTGYGLNKGHLGTETSSATGQTGVESGVGRPTTDSILNTGEKPKEVTIGGFNPKGAALDVDSSVHKPKEVEHISTDGPHGLVWQESTGKYVHRRELEGDTSREPARN